MKSLSRFVACLLTCLTLSLSSNASAQTCTGKFTNPVTDVCWSCMFPLTIGAVPIWQGGQEDIENPPSPICMCGILPYGKVGVAIGFWEPVRQVEIVRQPWCFPSLGGKTMGSKAAPPASVAHAITGRRASATTFYQSHWYVNAILYYLEVMAETSCLEEGGFDLAYATEVDPSWNDDDLAQILNPDVFLFANPAAQAACAADCVAATLDFPIPAMQWCGGCQGSMYPLNGHVQAHVGGVQASSLILQRYAMKLHRQFMAFAGNGIPGWCGLYPMPILDKRIYKYSMLYPVAQNKGPDGRCCQPLGRSTVVWGTGKEYPVKGEDYTYMMYRKRNCCEKVVGMMK